MEALLVSFQISPCVTPHPTLCLSPCLLCIPWVQVSTGEEGERRRTPAGAGLPSPPLLQARKEVTGSAHTEVGGFIFTLQDTTGPLDTVSASCSDRQDVTMEMGGWLKARHPGAVTPGVVSTPGLLPAPICDLL